MSLSIGASIPPDQTTHWVRSLYFSSWVTQLQNMLWEKIKEVFSPLVWELMVTSRLASIANVGKKTLENIDKGLFYIPTHAHLIDDMEPRHAAIAAATKALGLK